ncbi:MAG: DNA adenine methylase [Collinsella sp.]
MLIDDAAEILLIADLIEAAMTLQISRVRMVAFSEVDRQSSGALVVRPANCSPGSRYSIFRVGDVFTLETSPSDIVYLDPPYTKRQYASYYHIPETIAYHDEPAVEGVAGLRPWKKMASPFCYKTKALNAILECIAGLDASACFFPIALKGMSPRRPA